MKLLEAINIVLRGTSKPAINGIDDQSQDSTLARRTIRESRTEILSHGWRFNTRKVTLAVGDDGKVPVSVTYLSVKFKDKTDNERLVVQEDSEDNKLYVWNEDTDTWHDATIEGVTIVFDKGTDLDLEDTQFRLLPAKMARLIAYHAAAAYFQEINAVSSNDLNARAIRAQSSWVNSQVSTSLDKVSGFQAIKAAGHGGGARGSFDPRTQSAV